MTSRAATLASAAAVALLVPVLLAAAAISSDQIRPDGGSGIPPDLGPLYRAAAEAFDVHWLLLAAIHERETDFSRLDAPGVKDEWNGCGAAGPMQFGVVGVAPYNGTAVDCGALTGTGAGNTWARYAHAHRRLRDTPSTLRPAPCDRVPQNTGCVYDDRAAIAAAASYLHDLGARKELDERAWRAAQRYNGAAANADAVLARARAWEAEQAGDFTLTDPQTTPGATARLGPDGLARAPENALPEIKRAITAANAISDSPTCCATTRRTSATRPTTARAARATSCGPPAPSAGRPPCPTASRPTAGPARARGSRSTRTTATCSSTSPACGSTPLDTTPARTRASPVPAGASGPAPPPASPCATRRA